LIDDLRLQFTFENSFDGFHPSSGSNSEELHATNTTIAR
jgi:hypothetical protein